jgi:hypothetical protein
MIQCDITLPPELEPFRYEAGAGFGEWLKKQTSVARLIPSLQHVRELAQAGRSFVSLWLTTFHSYNGCLWQEEERLATALKRVADALLPFQGLDETTISGWSDEVWIALRDLPSELRRAARLVGLDPLIAPPDERERYGKDRVAAWNREIEQPFYDAAMSTAKGFTLTNTDKTILDWTHEGRQRGYKPTMSPAEGEARLKAAYRSWWSTPRLGTMPFDHETRHGLAEEVHPFSSGIDHLETALRRVDGERRQAPADGQINAAADRDHVDALGARAGLPSREAENADAPVVIDKNNNDTKIPPCQQKAYGQWLDAIRRGPFSKEDLDREVYGWVRDDLEEGESLPNYATWSRYVREVRKRLGESKYTPRAGRNAGRNVVRRRQLD